MFFDKMHEYLRDAAGREEASQEDVEWVYVHEHAGRPGAGRICSTTRAGWGLILGRTGYPVALEILTATAVKGRLDGDAVELLSRAYSLRRWTGKRARASRRSRDVLHVLQHDGYLERYDNIYRFVSGLLEDWWREPLRRELSMPVVES